MDRDILRFIDGKLGEGKTSALIIVENQDGSAPGEPGTLMAVCEDGTSEGTCGGGAIEKVLTRRALEGMERAAHFSFNFDLEKDLGMVCGGASNGFVRYFSPGLELVIFGAGHCAEALAYLTRHQRFSVTVVDDRDGYQDKDAFSHARFLQMTPEEAAGQIKFGPNTYIVAATWGHRVDQRVYQACLGKEYAFLGGLGSQKKAAGLKQALIAEGYDEAEVNALHLPVGIDLSDGTPEEIAVSILAELLLVKNRKPLQLKNTAPLAAL